MAELMDVVRVNWSESERGWGQRPDGTTLHLDRTTAQAYIDAHWARHEERLGNKTPDEYSFAHEIERQRVSPALHKRLVDAGGSMWWSPNHWPSVLARD